MRKFLYVFLALSMVFSLSTATFATDISTSGGSNEVPVELTQDASSFSVIVPTVLPVAVSASGEVTVSTNNRIINNSWGPVEVKAVFLESQNGWVLQDFETDFSQKKVGLKEYGFQLNSENVATDGSCSIDTFQVIDGGSELVFTYNANIATQSIALENEQIANVVFTMGWSSGSSSSAPSVEYAAIFADNEWSDIIIACETDTVPSTWSVGDTKTMEIGGDTYNIQIIGKNHDTYTSGGTAPLTFQLLELYNFRWNMYPHENNTVGWYSSGIRTSSLPGILSQMTDEVQSAIKPVDKLTLKGDKTGLETTSDKLFLLSEVEVFGTTTNSGGYAEGSYYEFYDNGGSVIKTFNGGDDYWWLRGPFYNDNGSFSFVHYPGYLCEGCAQSSRGISFAFCF